MLKRFLLNFEEEKKHFIGLRSAKLLNKLYNYQRAVKMHTIFNLEKEKNIMAK